MISMLEDLLLTLYQHASLFASLTDLAVYRDQNNTSLPWLDMNDVVSLLVNINSFLKVTGT